MSALQWLAHALPYHCSHPSVSVGDISGLSFTASVGKERKQKRIEWGPHLVHYLANMGRRAISPLRKRLHITQHLLAVLFVIVVRSEVLADRVKQLKAESDVGLRKLIPHFGDIAKHGEVGFDKDAALVEELRLLSASKFRLR